MRVVVIGATGNVGTGVVEALLAAPEVDEVVGVARRVPEEMPGGVEVIPADIATDPLAPHLRGADAVVHLGWLFQPTHRPTVTWRANVIGTVRVLDAVAGAGVPVLVHASSVGTYSGAPADDHPVDERWPTHSLPTAAYGREKAYCERLLDTFERDHADVRVVRMRPAFIFQRSSATEQRRIFAGPFAPASLLRRGRLPVLPYPKGLRFQALHTDDVAAAYVEAVRRDVRGPFNLASDDVVDGPALADLLGARPVELPSRLVRIGVASAWHARLVPADPNLYDLFMGLPLLDAGRARAELDWRPTRSARDALAEALEGMADGAGGTTPPLAPDRPDRRVAEVATGVGEVP